MERNAENYYVYTHTSPSQKVYVGITKNIKQRWGFNGEHYTWKQKNGEYMHKPFALAILKYGWENFQHTIILENIPKSEAIYAEKYLIRWYKLHNLSYNITDGGEGVLGHSHPISAERREAVSIFMRTNHPMKGKKHSEESRNKISQALKGRKLSAEQTAHISESLKGRKFTDEHKAKMRDHMKKHPERWAKGKERKEVHQYDLQGNYIQSFSSALEAALTLSGKNNAGCIRSCIYGEVNSALGYFWSYDKVEHIEIPTYTSRRTNTSKKVNQYSLEGIYLNTYNSIAEAARLTGIVDRSIGKCCSPDYKLKTAGGFKWEFDNESNRINLKNKEE